MLVGMSFDEVPNNSAFKFHFNDRMDYLQNVSSCAPFKEYSNSLIEVLFRYKLARTLE